MRLQPNRRCLSQGPRLGRSLALPTSQPAGGDSVQEVVHRRRSHQRQQHGDAQGADYRDGQRAEVRFDGLAGCLRTPRGGSGKQIVIAVEAGRLRMRWMSPREYARLQGVPDFPLVGGRNQQLFGFGDAVCVPAVEWVDRHVLTPLYEAGRRNGYAGQLES